MSYKVEEYLREDGTSPYEEWSGNDVSIPGKMKSKQAVTGDWP
jgi:hypothetical protein